MKAEIRSGSSFSGHERDKLWLRDPTGAFVDVSGLSGIDSVTDGRAFAWSDLDHDGDLDVVLVSANSPQVQIFENQLERRDVVAVRAPLGTRLHLASGELELRQEVRAGEGFAAQNSGTILLASGERATLRAVLPGGEEQEVEVLSGECVTFGEGAPAREPYRIPG